MAHRSVVSGSDTQCGLLGMGVARERQVGIVSGWSAPLQLVTVQPIMSVEYSTWAGCHLMPDRWVVESNAGDVGNSYRWLAGTLFGHRVAFADMDKLASAVPVASEGTLAFLGPSRMEMDSPGLRRGGFLFPVPLTLNQTNRGHLVRAALEAAAYALKANLLQAESTAGETAEDISVGGGMVQTATFVKALADVLGRQIRVPSDPQVSALGAYLCAATALGQFASLDEAAEVIAMDLRSVEPEPLASTEYRELYERWVEVSGQLETIGL